MLPPSFVFGLSTLLLFALVFCPEVLRGQATPTVKQAPPPGLVVTNIDAAELTAELDALGKQIERLRTTLSADHGRLALLPDVEVFHKAVRYALQYGEFFKPQEIAAARTQLGIARQRVQQLEDGQPAWASATGSVVRGYVSTIDGSVQPYALIVPEDWKPHERQARPLYLWFHGRNDTLSEVAFIAGRLKGRREFATSNAFELHLYGRYCNASKFAGETDAFEAMAAVRRHYSIDADRLVPMGFSMGGATVWHLAAHHAGLWAAASPGAGFAETAIYAKVFDAKQDLPTVWEQKLFHLYDATDYAANLANTRLIAYSGEIDPQKQSADIMRKAMAAEGMTLEALVGPRTGHQYEAETKQELSKLIDAGVDKGRERLPSRVRFVTYTLRYHQMCWLTLDALQQHWERAEIDAQILDRKAIHVKTQNITAFSIAFPPGPAPLDATRAPQIVIDQQSLRGPAMATTWSARFRKTLGKWQMASAEEPGLTKHHGLTGPIDDAFMDSFLFVRPTGKALHEKVGVWASNELERAVVEWRRVFRGDARLKDDRAVTADDIANCHLVLWGDPGANALIARVLERLPLQWTAETLTLGSRTLSAGEHAPILIYPNPLNPRRYIVLNSSFTFRQGSTTSNSLQTPKLPDWALIDLRTPPNLRWPGRVVDAGFFDEHWQFAGLTKR